MNLGKSSDFVCFLLACSTAFPQVAHFSYHMLPTGRWSLQLLVLLALLNVALVSPRKHIIEISSPLIYPHSVVGHSSALAVGIFNVLQLVVNIDRLKLAIDVLAEVFVGQILLLLTIPILGFVCVTTNVLGRICGAVEATRAKVVGSTDVDGLYLLISHLCSY